MRMAKAVLVPFGAVPAADGYLTLDELADYARVSRKLVERWIRRATDPLPAYHLGPKLIRVKRSEFDAWVKADQDRAAAVEARDPASELERLARRMKGFRR